MITGLHWSTKVQLNGRELDGHPAPRCHITRPPHPRCRRSAAATSSRSVACCPARPQRVLAAPQSASQHRCWHQQRHHFW